jgi:DNA invertase Pin-like site-specific DNA recombinase
MFQMMGVFAEFERAIIRERVMSGLARAKAEGITLGRRALEQSEPKKIDAIKAALAAGMACGASRARTRQVSERCCGLRRRWQSKTRKAGPKRTGTKWAADPR